MGTELLKGHIPCVTDSGTFSSWKLLHYLKGLRTVLPLFKCQQNLMWLGIIDEEIDLIINNLR